MLVLNRSTSWNHPEACYNHRRPTSSFDEIDRHTLVVPEADQSFEAVYYTAPWMPDWHQLAVMVLTFDKVHVPFSNLPIGDFDPKEAERRFKEASTRYHAQPRARIVDADDLIHLNMYRAAAFAEAFQGIWEYNVTDHWDLDKLEEVKPLADALELMTLGPRKENWSPIFRAGMEINLGGASGWVPGMYYYAAGAIVYAGARSLPLLHDDPEFIATLPSRGSGRSADVGAQLLVGAVSTALPRLGAIGPHEILELREATRDLIAPFRRHVMGLTYELRASLDAEVDQEELLVEVEHFCKVRIDPEVVDLRKRLTDPVKPWYRWIQDPLEFAVKFGLASTVTPANHVAVGALSGVAKMCMDVADAQKIKDGLRKNPMYFLVQLDSATR